MAMHMLGYSLDNLSLMALTLAIGFLVDDAIVFLENTVRRMETGKGACEATLNSAREISFTILAMTLSLAAVFMPLVFMSGLVGRIFREFSDHDHRLDLRQRRRLADAHAADVLAAAGQPRRRDQEDLDGARLSAAWSSACWTSTARSLWFFLRHRWVSAVIWVVCLVGHGLAVLRRAEGVPARRRQLLHPRRDGGAGRLVAGADARNTSARPEDILHANPAVDMTFTMTGVSRFLPANQGFLLAFLKDPDPAARPSSQVAGQLMGGDHRRPCPGAWPSSSPTRCCEISTGATATHAGQVRLRHLRHRPERGLRRRPAS